MRPLLCSLFISLIPVPGCLLPLAAIAAEPTTGNWVRAGSHTNTSAVLTLHQRTADQATLSLEVISRSGPTTARTGTLDKVVVPIIKGVALYREAGTTPEACSIVFALGATVVQVTQFGHCEMFGVGIDATGKYLRELKR